MLRMYWSYRAWQKRLKLLPVVLVGSSDVAGWEGWSGHVTCRATDGGERRAWVWTGRSWAETDSNQWTPRGWTSQRGVVWKGGQQITPRPGKGSAFLLVSALNEGRLFPARVVDPVPSDTTRQRTRAGQVSYASLVRNRVTNHRHRIQSQGQCRSHSTFPISLPCQSFRLTIGVCAPIAAQAHSLYFSEFVSENFRIRERLLGPGF